MIFQFPDYATLEFALTNGDVPLDVSLKPAIAGVDEAKRPWVEPAVKTPRGLTAQLARLGVTSPKSYPSAGESVGNWLQVLPLRRVNNVPDLAPNATVLFELPDASLLPEVVGEMLRLGVDRQNFRWLRDEQNATSVLLKVHGPPYYTLLRALDRDQFGRSALRAFLPAGKRVWVEVGWTHPLIETLEPPEDQALMLRSPNQWVFIAEAGFRDIYEILDFKLPHGKVDWDAAELKKKLIVPMRLIESDKHDAELWVLRHDPVGQLDALVRDANESLIQRLIFSVGQIDDQLVIVLRVRPSKQKAPSLVVDAEAYSKFLKLDNLFVPVGTRLHPVLRRDAVRQLLAEDPAHINWLRLDPQRKGAFTPESLPDDSFRPLQDWVDYVLDRDRQALTHWVQEFKFDFDPFDCPEEAEAEPPAKKAARRRASMKDDAEPQRGPLLEKKAAAKSGDERTVVELEDIDDVAESPPTQLQLELTALEQRFLEQDGSLDDVERLRLWPEMASRNAALNHPHDAGLCWMNLLWEMLDLDLELADLRQEGDDARREARRDRVERLQKLRDDWGGEEAIAWRWVRQEKLLTEKRLLAGDLDRMVKNPNPTLDEVRGLVACLVWGSRHPDAAKAIVGRLPQIQQFLLKYERSMGLRTVWLGWQALAKLSHDALALARVRDRLIDRLVNEGYSVERDLPNFLRSAGRQDGGRTRIIREQIDKLHELALKWCGECQNREWTVRDTSGHYVDLIFAFGLARLNEPTRSRDLIRSAEQRVAAKKAETSAARGTNDAVEVSELLVSGFRYRIEEIIQGRPHRGPLKESWRDELDRRMAKGSSANTLRFVVDRMREQSRILEPQERFDPYRDYTRRHAPELDQRLAALPDIKDAKELMGAVQDLLRSVAGKPPSVDELLSILADALMLSPRVGEAFTLELLDRVIPALDRVPSNSDSALTLENQALLLERALIMAANYERVEVVQQLWPRFVQLLQRSLQGKSRKVSLQFGQCFRSLRKLGLRDDITKLIEHADRMVRGTKSLASIQASSGKDWPLVLMTLLHVAGGWLVFDKFERAQPVLDAARELLYSPKDPNHKDGLFPQMFGYLAVAYVTVLGLAPVENALRRIEELFKKMRRLDDTFTTAPYFARLHLNIIEAVVLAIVNEDFAMGPSAKKWIDDDEYLVRRRVHRDHRAMASRVG